jgi:hypothetical protein
LRFWVLNSRARTDVSRRPPPGPTSSLAQAFFLVPMIFALPTSVTWPAVAGRRSSRGPTPSFGRFVGRVWEKQLQLVALPRIGWTYGSCGGRARGPIPRTHLPNGLAKGAGRSRNRQARLRTSTASPRIGADVAGCVTTGRTVNRKEPRQTLIQLSHNSHTTAAQSPSRSLWESLVRSPKWKQSWFPAFVFE